MRACKMCGVDKPLDAFRPNSQNPKWRLRTCRQCEAEKMRLWRYIPISRGGDHSVHNTQVAHLDCNRKKHAALPWDYEHERRAA